MADEKTYPKRPDQSRLKVTKEQLEASGLSLRDYMNKQLGLKRRDGSAPESASTAKAPAKAPAKAAASTSENPKENPTFDPAAGSSEALATSMRKSQSQQRASDASGETAKTNKSVEAASKLTNKDFDSLENVQRRKATMEAVKSVPSAIGDYVSSLGKRKETGHGTYVKDGKVVKYAKGGSVSSRADGCAQRGKTKGMMR
jgi:hypothetical protein